MRIFTSSILIFTLCHASNAAEPASTPGADYHFKIPPKAKELLSYYCYECHDADRDEGIIQLDNLESLDQPERLQTLNKILEQVYSGEMPTKKGEQPLEEERDALANWAWKELKSFNASNLEDKLRYYKYGNYINHEKLFRGDIKSAPYTKSRRWRVNELIYHERINDVFELEGRGRRDAFFGVVKPFNLPTDPGVSYYDHEIVEGGQFLTLLSNAKWIVDKQLRFALEKSGKFQHPAEYIKMQNENPRMLRTRFPDEIWNPGRTAEPFTEVIKSTGTPTDDLLENAITHQFKVALQREPNEAEMTKYIDFMKITTKNSDATSALRKMMVSVLMEPEFLYRNEFGGGEPDEQHRKKLTPREASYAISYALTDHIPDAKLVEAANSGKLETAADYEREVRRILADDSIDKPRILRFFQDYFGYKGIFHVFKDEERFGGAYNPHRVVSTRYIYRVPGRISGEADTLINWVLANDKNVLETLLTTDQFFVHHNGNNTEMAAKAKQATDKFHRNRIVYKALKGVHGRDWGEAIKKLDEKNPNYKFTQEYLTPDGKTRRHLGLILKQSKLHFGEDGTRNENAKWTYPPQDDEAVEHSVQMYDINIEDWNYQAEQPFKVANRAGILTHPAWLVAFSHNAATDPILRGKWVREKLLGGFIRDVPITVDAKVPEDPHSTLRERFAVTEEKSCWVCHDKMNPLGYPFESYDDFGRFRVEEPIEYPENILNSRIHTAKDSNGIWKDFKVPVYKTKPVNPLGYLDSTGDKSLDGNVTSVPDMMQRLAQSDRVRQVFVRNVFRYFMGRNETLSDSPTLIRADKAYLESGGSFRELMVSILTSDSFIYRK